VKTAQKESAALVVFQDPKHTLEIRWPKLFAMALFDFKATVRKSSWTTYEVALRDFFGFLEQVGVRSPECVVTTHLTSYLEYLRQEGKADRTICCYAGAISSFYDFLMRPMDTKGTCIIKSNPWNSIRDALPKIQPYVKANPLVELSIEDYRKILATCGADALMDIRDRAILSLILWTIRRRKEIIRLRVEDFKLDQGKPFVRFLVKGGDYLSIELNPEIWGAIQAYWKASGRQLGPRSPVFTATTTAGNNLLKARNLRPHTEEGPLAPSSLDRMLKARARAAGIDETLTHVHVHGLRHLGARALREMGVDIKKIKERLGHANLDTTDIYLGSMKKIGMEGLSDFAKLALGKDPQVS
jgi:integrase